jgi:hypothetical protein
MNKTAIQQLLSEINQLYFVEEDLLISRIKSMILSKLPTEQEQIEQAYKQGCAYINPSFTKEHWDIDANIYYNETYKTE